jgi:predicted metal-dependent HD superfamily phosphohydrolase
MDHRARLIALLERLGVRGGSGPLADAVLAAWSGGERHYHGLRHLRDCLQQLDQMTEPVPDRNLVEAALWFHDAVYDPHRTDNEVRSAEWAREGLTRLGIDPAVAAEVARLVMLTAHRRPPDDPAGQLVTDIDLAMLGRPAAEFDAYDAAIRAEFAWVPEDEYRTRRGALLAGLLAREPLYLTPWFRARYEVAARDNLRRCLAGLTVTPGSPEPPQAGASKRQR